MRLFWRRPPLPPAVEAVTVDQEAAERDLSKVEAFQRSAQDQSAQADAVVSRLVESRIRNGFAPAIEESIMHKYLGGAAS